jgi:translation initiation factor IF-3
VKGARWQKCHRVSSVFAQYNTLTEQEIPISDPRINDRIRANEVRLVGPEGEQVGVVRIDIALRLAQEADLDLVEVSPNSNPPVVKVMDYGKFKYEAAQKAKEARKNQANTILKEVRFRLKIDTHDYETKRKRAESFLRAGDKVKAMILFRGREQSRPEQGVRLLQRFAEDVAQHGVVEFTPMIDGRNMVMIIAPLTSKADAKAAQAKERGKQAKAEKAAELELENTPEPVVAAPAADSATPAPPATKPKATPVAKPATKAAAKPAAKAATKTAAKPVAKTPAAPKATKTTAEKEEKDA